MNDEHNQNNVHWEVESYVQMVCGFLVSVVWATLFTHSHIALERMCITAIKSGISALTGKKLESCSLLAVSHHSLQHWSFCNS